MNKHFTSILILSLLIFLSPPLVFAQKKGKKDKEQVETLNSNTQKKPRTNSDLKPYASIIKPGTKSDEGLFKVHFVKNKIYFEIPDSLLNVDMLLVSRIAQLPANFGGGYVNAGRKSNEQLVHWERKGEQILLRKISYRNVADPESPIYESVQVNNLAPIIQAFKIEALSPDKQGSLINVSSLYNKDVPSLSGISRSLRTRYKVRSLDASRSFIDTVRSFPINVEVKHTMTYRATAPPSDSESGTITMQMNQSMILLPKNPMVSRLHDERVGWFSLSKYNYSSDALKSDRKTYIRRWRLEPKDPEAYARGELVEPIKPIVYYLDPATPLKWRPYFKKGIEEWQKAFEAAGFKNAIIAKDPPSPEEDPEFSPEDARYSVVRYIASTTRNAIGPSVTDPRSGEIIESDIIWYHNHLRSYRNRYLLETGAANPKARSLNTPEAEIGEMMRMVIAHEVGHALGLPHNMKASSAYPVDSLRSGSFTQKMGIAPSIMDYARYNYIAQPGDKNIRYVRQLGPYDVYAINWGYRVIPGADSPEAEWETLQKWIAAKVDDPIYQFGSSSRNPDPNSQTECIGDDAVKASEYGIKNLKIVAPNLLKWTTGENQTYDDLEELYGELLGVWRRYLGHVMANIGGVHQTLKNSSQSGDVYQVVSKSDQKKAMDFLLKEAFSSPDWLMRKDILQKISASGVIERMRSVQGSFLRRLLDVDRMHRMIEAEALGEDTYTSLEMLNDLRQGLFSELRSRQSIKVCRRNLQKVYVEQMIGALSEDEGNTRNRNNTAIAQSDIRSLVKAQLKTLKNQLKFSSANYPDALSRYHLQDIQERIEEALNPS